MAAEGLPAERITRAVRAAFGADAAVVALDALAGDASSRRYVRVRLAGSRAPRTAVAMILGQASFGGADEIGAGGTPVELPFVNVGRYLATHGFPVPALYLDAAAREDLLLLEDIGDTNLWSAANSASADVDALFGAAVDLLVRLQVTGRRTPDTACVAFSRRFDATLARAELEHFLDHGIETRHGRPLPGPERAALLQGLAPVVTLFAEAEPVLAHRDFMAWNLHVQEGRLRLIDFQDAFLAPDACDLASLLTDRRTSELLDARRTAALVTRFLEGRAAAGMPVAGDFRERLALATLHRALRVIGRFYFLERVKGKPGYLAYLPPIYGVARRSFDALPALAAVRSDIAAHVPELGASA